MANENNDIEAIENELNERQKAFCKRYILDWNGTKSYKEVYKVESDDVAGASAARLLGNVKIQAHIEYLKKNLAEVAGVSPLMVLQEHMKIAFSSIAHLHLTWIERKEFEALTPDQKACIAEIDTKIIRKVAKEFNEKSGEFEPVPYDVEYVRIKLYDKQKSLDSINKMQGWDAPIKVASTNTKGEDMPNEPKFIINCLNYDIPVKENNENED